MVAAGHGVGGDCLFQPLGPTSTGDHASRDSPADDVAGRSQHRIDLTNLDLVPAAGGHAGAG